MDNPAVIWAALGLVLIIVELLTGTFFLLVIGSAAFGGSIAAYFGQGFAIQVLVFALAAAIGMYVVHSHRAKSRAEPMPPVDAGQPAAFEEWLDESARLARVQYRGATWEARLEGELPGLAAGARLYVKQMEGSRLVVGASVN